MLIIRSINLNNYFLLLSLIVAIIKAVEPTITAIIKVIPTSINEKSETVPSGDLLKFKIKKDIIKYDMNVKSNDSIYFKYFIKIPPTNKYKQNV
jgi:hypothetical protein